MYGFLRTPKWILGHILVVVTVVSFVAAGFWQLDRLASRRAYNALVSERGEGPPQDLTELLAAVGEDGDALAYHMATVTGRYRTDREVVVTGRSLDGQPGMHVLTPLVTDTDRTVIVDRGWVPYEVQPDPPVATALPPEGEVTVTGMLFPDEPGARSGPQGAGSGDIDYVTQVDLGLLATPDLPPLAPVYLAMAEQQPAQSGALPRTVEPPPLDDGPHLSYAVQWFLFTAIVLVGYPLLVWRTARERRRDAAAGAERVPAASSPR